ncbi:MAG: acyl-CoA/acyl-ACP dehydrogenase [Candidatus Tectomicrobia bacterium]|uniref:Acyl-CoA/acyl-ACP dehydrogenase n=1 Tax=Tectimicrobiota bacterium TaxID=2528274 RepID=A0A932CRD1_UNCTE|nr:acyl-CoA/acyl-ACP dehydrogenase [Candidatus Tectomicrobia bacterium]
MDIKLNEDQVEIARQARRFCENESPMKYVRAMFQDERGFTDDIWNKMVEMGWTAMRIPEAYGGLGMELLDLSLVLEEMGRAVVPGPFFSAVLLAAEPILEAGSEAQKQRYLPEIAAGTLRGTLALYEPEGGADIGHIQMSATAEGKAFILHGTKLFVPDAQVANLLVCAARTEAGEDPERGVTLFLVDPRTPGISISPLPAMDGTRKLCAVEFQQVRVDREGVLGTLHQGGGALRRALQRAQVGLCAECVGGAQRAMEIATEYANVRVQFDQPIGAYQAIKHRCAQTYIETESARSVLYWAAWAQDHADPQEATMAASVAKAYGSEVYRNAATNTLQTLGGTGFSWEHDIHLYLKRAKANEVALGDPIYHRERIARLLTE